MQKKILHVRISSWTIHTKDGVFMDFNRIEYFLVLAKTLNFLEASKQLYISPHSLNKQIMLLEKEAGGRLLERTTRNVKLTELGQICFERFFLIKKQYDGAVNDIQHMADSSKEILRISFLSDLPKEQVINPILQIISETCPKLNFDITTNESEEIKDLLENDDIDLCITNINEFEHWEKCTVKKLDTNNYDCMLTAFETGSHFTAVICKTENYHTNAWLYNIFNNLREYF